jgi:hypothetical protein
MSVHKDLLQRHKAVLPSWMALYYNEPISLVDGDGRRVTDAEGVTYLDFFGGILTTMTGYNVPEIVEAVKAQAERMVHTSTLYLIESQIELAEKIAGLSGIPDAKVFFTNSGTEANDAALMLATQYRRSNQILALRGSYHGKSHSTVAITGQRSWSATSLSPFDVTYVHSGYKLRSRSATSGRGVHRRLRGRPREPARGGHGRPGRAMIAEPIQGVGRLRHPPDGFFGAMKEVLDREGILFISDEVQTGWGRTGEHFWGYQSHGIVPTSSPSPRASATASPSPAWWPGPRSWTVPQRQFDLHLRRQPPLDRRGAGQPRLPPRARPAVQRLQDGRPAQGGARLDRLRDAGDRRGARQGTHGGCRGGWETGPPTRRGCRRVMEEAKAGLPPDRQGRPVRQHTADRPAPHRDRRRGRRRPRNHRIRRQASNRRLDSHGTHDHHQRDRRHRNRPDRGRRPHRGREGGGPGRSRIPRLVGRRSDRCGGQIRRSGRSRRPHPYGAAVRWHLRLRHLRDRAPGRRRGAEPPRSWTSPSRPRARA